MTKRHFADNILAVKDVLDEFSITSAARALAERVRTRRLELNLSQEGLAARSGVSYGSVKRFESHGEISLKSLLKIAFVLNSLDSFQTVFSQKKYIAIKQVIDVDKNRKRKRGRTNV